jgi:hypothetical protein
MVSAVLMLSILACLLILGRSHLSAALYFFTVVTYQRQPLFDDVANIKLLRAVFREVKAVLPFEIEAMVVLPAILILEISRSP